LLPLSPDVADLIPATAWTETKPAGDVDKYWNSIAMSNDGAKIFAGAGNNSGRPFHHLRKHR